MSMPVADITPWRELCADFATQAIYAKHSGELQHFGKSGKQACRQDILYHIDYIQGALSGNDPDIFVQYALWLKDVLISRGVPVSHLSLSFDLLSIFFSKNLNTVEANSVTAVLDTARTALLLDTQPDIHWQTRLPSLSGTDHYCESILQGDHKAAIQLVSDAMKNGNSLPQVSVQLVQPALYEIGNLWQKNRISVSQEHMATAISQNALASAYMQASFAPPIGKTAMFACVEGNHHSLGSRMLSDAFETTGWKVFYLGANLPTRDLVREVDTKHPELLALSVSLPSHIDTARLTIESLHAEMGNNCPEIWVGGLATLSNQQIWRITKADGWAADALHSLEQLVDRTSV